MGKYKKIILIVCVVSLLLVTVCIIPASAVVTDYGYVSIPVLEPQLLGNNTVVELLITDSNGAYHAVMFNFSAFPTDTTLPTRFELAISTTAIKANGIITGNGAGTLSCMMVRDDGYVSYQSILNQTDNDRDFYFSFGTSSYQTILGYKVYGNFGEVSVDSRVKNQEFNFIYGADNVQYGQLQAILGAVNGLGNISGQITANQNQNTQEIIQNQQQQTDSILNGGSDEPPYSAPDTSDVDQMHESEDYIIEQTSTGRNNAVSVFTGVGSVLSDTSFSNGMLFVSSFFNEFFGISWLNSIGSISLALGLFAFIIGSVVVVGRAVTKRKGGD